VRWNNELVEELAVLCGRHPVNIKRVIRNFMRDFGLLKEGE